MEYKWKLSLKLINHFKIFKFKRNGTEYQNLTILTGKDDITQVGKILTWNNLIKLPFWDSDLANQIQGSDGSLFGPFKTKKDTLYVFNSDVCRSKTKNILIRN